MSNTVQSAQPTFPILGIMVLILFAGKIFEVTPTLAAMSWWWVFAPVWIPLGMILGGLALFAAGALVYYGVRDGWTKRQRAAKMTADITKRLGK